MAPQAAGPNHAQELDSIQTRPSPEPDRTYPDLETFDVLAWNALVGRDPGDVIATIRMFARVHRPQAMIFNEFERYARYVDRFGISNYNPLIAHGWDGAGANIMLVRDDMMDALVGWRPVVGDAHWRGPKAGKRQPPRTYIHATFGSARAGLNLWGVHRTPEEWGAGGPNGAAAEEYEALVRAGMRSPRRALAIVGDQNSRPYDDSRYTTGSVMNRIGGRSVQAKGANGVDWALLRGRDRGQRKTQGSAVSLGRHGSDHDAVLYHFEF